MAETFGVLVRFGPRSPQKKAPEKISEEMPGASLVLFRSSCPNSKPHNLTLETRSRKAPSRRKGQFSTGMPISTARKPFFLHLFTVKNHCGFMSNVSSGNKGILSDGYGSKPCFCSQLRQLLDLPPSTLVSLTSLIKIGVSKRGKSLLQGEQSPKSLLDYWPYLR